MAAPPRLPPQLPDVIVEEILVRLPADDPASLLRAALACKRFARLVSGPGFRARLRDFHRAAGPPMLGFFCDHRGPADGVVSRFVPTSTIRPRATVRRGWRAADSRHGRVLLYPLPKRFEPFRNVVLEVRILVTGEHRNLPGLPRRPLSWSAAVLCGADGTCGHHPGCHRGPFRVVFVGTDKGDIFSCVYSSVEDAWSQPASVEHPLNPPACIESVPGVLVGNALHFLFQGSASILRYDLGTREVTVFPRPPTCVDYQGRPLLMNMEDGRLGFASVLNSRLSLWPREVGADGEARWVQSREIELETLLPANALLTLPYLLGFADGVGVLFVWTVVGGVMLVNLKSSRVTQVEIHMDIYGVVPYVTYYTPGTTATLLLAVLNLSVSRTSSFHLLT
jgi:hypothetical protein